MLHQPGHVPPINLRTRKYLKSHDFISSFQIFVPTPPIYFRPPALCNNELRSVRRPWHPEIQENIVFLE
jgi:hypothetical protein